VYVLTFVKTIRLADLNIKCEYNLAFTKTAI